MILLLDEAVSFKSLEGTTFLPLSLIKLKLLDRSLTLYISKNTPYKKQATIARMSAGTLAPPDAKGGARENRERNTCARTGDTDQCHDGENYEWGYANGKDKVDETSA